MNALFCSMTVLTVWKRSITCCLSLPHGSLERRSVSPNKMRRLIDISVERRRSRIRQNMQEPDSSRFWETRVFRMWVPTTLRDSALILQSEDIRRKYLQPTSVHSSWSFRSCTRGSSTGASLAGCSIQIGRSDSTTK